MIAVVFFLLFTAKGIITLDSDFGWHIRMGQIILQNGIPKTDPFSYTMPSYPFVDHEWLTNIIIAVLYTKIGMMGLAIIFSILVTVTIYIQIFRLYSNWSALVIILLAAALFPIAGIRTQIITWLLVSILIWILSDLSKHKIYRYLPILLMLVWTNLHGAFPVGIVLILMFYITRWWTHKKISFQEILIVAASCAVTFLNPYGYRLWWEVWMQLTDSSLHFTILEWMPAFFFMNVALWLYVVMSVMLTYRYRNKFSLFHKISYIVFLLAGISTFRHLPLWIIISLYPTLRSFTFFYDEISKYKYGKKNLRSFYLILIAISLFSLTWHLGWYFFGISQNREDHDFPKNAIVFIKKNLPKGKIFVPYEWGGYMDWKLPEKKVFIDGRMPSFRWKQNNPDESNYAFKEYRKAMYGSKKDFLKIMKKYNVEIVMMPAHEAYVKNRIDIAFEKIIEQYTSKNKKTKEDKFKDLKIIYKDKTTIVYTF